VHNRCNKIARWQTRPSISIFTYLSPATIRSMTLSPTSAVPPIPQLLSKQASLHLTVLTPLVFPWISKKSSFGHRRLQKVASGPR
jgi:hypothetical protein